MQLLNPPRIQERGFCENISQLKSVKFFRESSSLDAWWQPESASGSIRAFFPRNHWLYLIDIFCSFFIDLINDKEVRKSFVHLILICTFFFLHGCFNF